MRLRCNGQAHLESQDLHREQVVETLERAGRRRRCYENAADAASKNQSDGHADARERFPVKPSTRRRSTKRSRDVRSFVRRSAKRSRTALRSFDADNYRYRCIVLRCKDRRLSARLPRNARRTRRNYSDFSASRTRSSSRLVTLPRMLMRRP